MGSSLGRCQISLPSPREQAALSHPHTNKRGQSKRHWGVGRKGWFSILKESTGSEIHLKGVAGVSRSSGSVQYRKSSCSWHKIHNGVKERCGMVTAWREGHLKLRGVAVSVWQSVRLPYLSVCVFLLPQPLPTTYDPHIQRLTHIHVFITILSRSFHWIIFACNSKNTPPFLNYITKFIKRHHPIPEKTHTDTYTQSSK